MYYDFKILSVKMLNKQIQQMIVKIPLNKKKSNKTVILN